MEKTIKILVVDGHELVRTAIRYVLADAADIEIVGEAGAGHEAIEAAQKLSPDVVLLDLKSPDIDGLEVVKKIRCENPKTKILILTASDDFIYIRRLLDSGGVFGCMTKNAKEEELISAIRKVYNNERYISSHIAQRLLLNGFCAAADNQFNKLSNRELQVALMLTQGCLVTNIAQQLHLTRKTINTHRYSIFEKLNVNNDVKLTLLAVCNNLSSVSY